MKVVITTEGSTMEDRVDPRFGRCRKFLLADTENEDVQAVPNDAVALGGGAGIQAAQNVVDMGAQAVITGQLGPKAAQAIQAGGTPVYVGASGTAREALKSFKEGRLKTLQRPAPGTGMGRGRGMGPGQGRGMGRGRERQKG